MGIVNKTGLILNPVAFYFRVQYGCAEMWPKAPFELASFKTLFKTPLQNYRL
jgi:hypothetical protein